MQRRFHARSFLKMIVFGSALLGAAAFANGNTGAAVGWFQLAAAIAFSIAFLQVFAHVLHAAADWFRDQPEVPTE